VTQRHIRFGAKFAQCFSPDATGSVLKRLQGALGMTSISTVKLPCYQSPYHVPKCRPYSCYSYDGNHGYYGKHCAPKSGHKCLPNKHNPHAGGGNGNAGWGGNKAWGGNHNCPPNKYNQGYTLPIPCPDPIKHCDPKSDHKYKYNPHAGGGNGNAGWGGNKAWGG
jgi:hypothetical protein